ncbi:hypothetical protein GCM10010415_19350 [Streptomyces atrovirens]
MTASVGSSIRGSGTFSTLTSRFPCQVSALIAARSLRGGRCVARAVGVRVPERPCAEPPVAEPIGGSHRAGPPLIDYGQQR